MKKHQGRRKKPKVKKCNPQVKSVEYLLESDTLVNMRKAKRVFSDHLKYHWDFYSELAHQRNNIAEQIAQTLNLICKPYEFTQWQSIVGQEFQTIKMNN